MGAVVFEFAMPIGLETRLRARDERISTARGIFVTRVCVRRPGAVRREGKEEKKKECGEE